MVYIFIILLVLVFLVWSAADIASGVYVKTFCGIKECDEKVVSLTFDDGPEPVTTEKVLEVLKKYDVKATFFCIGKKIEPNCEVFKHIITFGHTLGNHSFHHNDNFSLLLPSRMRDEIGRCQAEIKKYAGYEPRFFRPPLGVTNPMLAIALRSFRFDIIGWNVRPFDTSAKNAEEVSRRVISKIRPGSVVLLHDRMPHTPEALETILDWLYANGYRVVPLEEMMSRQRKN
ncbi:MAG: polysaccharide deacetylase family protein [Bacteroidales bacterium]|nr:polysaccharide deacetylase family protein [Candidatus Scybalocola fimicaballi]